MEGDPNHDSATRWPAATPDGAAALRFDTAKDTVIDLAADRNCAPWDSLR